MHWASSPGNGTSPTAERIKRKAANWARSSEALPPGERNSPCWLAVMAARPRTVTVSQEWHEDRRPVRRGREEVRAACRTFSNGILQSQGSCCPPGMGPGVVLSSGPELGARAPDRARARNHALRGAPHRRTSSAVPRPTAPRSAASRPPATDSQEEERNPEAHPKPALARQAGQGVVSRATRGRPSRRPKTRSIRRS